MVKPKTGQPAWEAELFRLLVDAGGVAFEEAHRALNMGVGMVVMVEESDAKAVLSDLNARGERAFRLGRVVAGEGRFRWA